MRACVAAADLADLVVGLQPAALGWIVVDLHHARLAADDAVAAGSCCFTTGLDPALPADVDRHGHDLAGPVAGIAVCWIAGAGSVTIFLVRTMAYRSAASA